MLEVSEEADDRMKSSRRDSWRRFNLHACRPLQNTSSSPVLDFFRWHAGVMKCHSVEKNTPYTRQNIIINKSLYLPTTRGRISEFGQHR